MNDSFQAPRAGILAFAGATLCLALAGCGTRYVSRDISPDGVAGQVVFPQADSAVLGGGTFPNVDNVRLVDAGMTKDQLYALLGRPHFREGYAGVREWDYLFHFRKDGQVITCQYKAIFDTQYIARTFHWMPQACADVLKGEAKTAAPQRRFTLSADALFDFAKSGLEDIRPDGRKELDTVAEQLRGADIESVVVIGHTDRIGRDESNEVLSRERAETVRGYFIGKGVPANRVRAEGRGEREPVKACPDAPHADLVACLQPNRRVEIVGIAVNGSAE